MVRMVQTMVARQIMGSRYMSCSRVLLERSNVWKLPEIQVPQEPRTSAKQHSGSKSKNKKFASLNGGVTVPENWRAVKKIPEWKRQKFALKEKFGDEGWNPKKKLSRETMDQIKVLNKEYPEINTRVLSEAFSMSPEAIRRILKSSFRPSVEESEKILERWRKRGERHLQFRLLDKVSKDIVEEKRLELGDDSADLELLDADKLREAVSEKILGTKDVRKPGS